MKDTSYWLEFVTKFVKMDIGAMTEPVLVTIVTITVQLVPLDLTPTVTHVLPENPYMNPNVLLHAQMVLMEIP